MRLFFIFGCRQNRYSISWTIFCQLNKTEYYKFWKLVYYETVCHNIQGLFSHWLDYIQNTECFWKYDDTARNNTIEFLPLGDCCCLHHDFILRGLLQHHCFVLRINSWRLRSLVGVTNATDVWDAGKASERERLACLCRGHAQRCNVWLGDYRGSASSQFSEKQLLTCWCL